jgi:hypothetical protein
MRARVGHSSRAGWLLKRHFARAAAPIDYSENTGVLIDELRSAALDG